MMGLSQPSNIGQPRQDRLNTLVRYTLMAGLALSLLLMIMGVVLLQFQPMVDASRSMFGRQMFAQLLVLNPVAFLSLGIIVLMLTPAVRVAAAGVGYLLARDGLFAAVSLGVLAILAVSVLVGAA